MNAIKKNDENLVKVAREICSTFDNHGFFSNTDFEPINHVLFLYSTSISFSDVVLKEIPTNYNYCIRVCDSFLGLCIWYD